ncbi:aminotransferase class V-fold PLP-dependent enzyme [Dyadobacter fanqingshengii]|uniref:Aminotransferase class V-fold PLP-dependent enzyme n=1 Tax=Dyadobacter fanqingshengii TaxID=2906443 RepID=A0A9X1PAU1_9BACT|nr:aminotransferase class V-fold PLP-dependent enzyme [Dyadobacter fanqingshengii]MCF0040253.1 aminotransferase class V-fold PLP-dependent enzyme [Dyadobacter fanqingshengii]MCF2502262.1 aminotransferase class V-fold PLP-dependent enzyme [Dyadobacter fanqingshengii]USJ37999.1 aminotransferase class V-fold PLP-dependent enzyme [Dyadobacter fanqingshengii]
MINRRDLIKHLSAVPLLGGFLGNGSAEAATFAAKLPARNLAKELGIRTFINAAGTYTAMTGSLMQEEVVETIQGAAQNFMMLDEVQTKVGEKIAALTHAESAVVTAGCFSALTLGLAGVLTGMDQKRVEALPHLEGTGMKSEVIIQKGHNIGYSHALTNTGCKIIQVETVEELEKAINEKTALLWFLHIQSDKGQIMHEKWVEIAKKHGIATMIDMAADVPPVENLWRFNDMGFDLVCVSGGKAMRGPQSAGILMGKKHLIDAARLSMPPRGSTIGRGMKVNKEEILGMYVALEKFVKMDHKKEWKMWEDRAATIGNAAKSIAGVNVETFAPELGNHTPTLRISWDSAKVSLPVKLLQENLRKGDPSIEIMPGENNTLTITTWCLKPGEEKIVATRLKEELSKAVV